MEFTVSDAGNKVHVVTEVRAGYGLRSIVTISGNFASATAEDVRAHLASVWKTCPCRACRKVRGLRIAAYPVGAKLPV